MIKPRVTFKERDLVKEDPIVVGRKMITRIAKESVEKGQADFSDDFNVADLTDQDVQNFLDLGSGKLDIVDFQDRTKSFVGVLNPSQKELWDYIGNKLREDLDRR